MCLQTALLYLTEHNGPFFTGPKLFLAGLHKIAISTKTQFLQKLGRKFFQKSCFFCIVYVNFEKDSSQNEVSTNFKILATPIKNIGNSFTKRVG